MASGPEGRILSPKQRPRYPLCASLRPSTADPMVLESGPDPGEARSVHPPFQRPSINTESPKEVCVFSESDKTF